MRIYRTLRDLLQEALAQLRFLLLLQLRLLLLQLRLLPLELLNLRLHGFTEQINQLGETFLSK